MKILHGSWCKNNFFFWAEVKKEGKFKCKKHEGISLHPFQATKEELLAILNLSSNYIHELRTIQLPAYNNLLRPSVSFLIDQFNDYSETELTLSEFKVNCIGINVAKAVPLLILLPEGNIHLGEDIYFWSSVAKWTLELLSRQRFIPSITVDKNGIKAIWKPIINHPNDLEKLSILSEAVPPVCYSLSGVGYATELITDFINNAVDELIHQWLTEKYSQYKFFDKENIISVFLHGLTSNEQVITSSTHNLKVLKESITLWEEKLNLKPDKRTFRTCLRLEEPSLNEEENNWNLSFHLQATDDKSLIIPAEYIWGEATSTFKYLNYKFANPQQVFLQDLAQASRLFEPIKKSLKNTQPVGCRLNLEEAYMFLKEGAFLLEESGYGVLVPSWWERKRQLAQLGVKLRISAPRSYTETRFTFDTLVDFKWDVAIGDETLTKEEFEKLAELKQPLVRIRGKWVEIQEEQIQATLKFWNEVEKKGLTFKEAINAASSLENISLPVVEFTTDGWLDAFLNCKFGKLPQPRQFNGKLREYQLEGFSWLVFLRQIGVGACLADDMGLGKTIQLIALLLYDKERQKKDKINPVLLICPTSIVGNWGKELKKFSPTLKVFIHHGQERLTGKEFVKEAKKHDIVISTYSLAHRDCTQLSRIKWEGIILDEAQNIKNPNTKQARAIRTLNSNYRVALTGTPIENRLTELWSIMEFLNSNYLDSLSNFKARFAIPIERYKSQEALHNLSNLIRPFILRRVKTDKNIIKDLPEKLEMKVYCTLSQEQATLYKATVDEMLTEIETLEGIQRKGNILATLVKLKQICNHPCLFLHEEKDVTKERSGKLQRLTEMLEEVIAINDKALVFTQFAEMGSMLKKYLQAVFNKEILFLHGGTPRKKRDEMIKHFQEQKGNEIPVFVLSLKAGGFGLNLTKANHVFHFDRWWNPAVENQATDRVFRIGQQKNVQVYKFICIGTFEEKIDELLESKKELAEKIIVTAGEGWLTELSNEQLRNIFTLRKEVFQE